MSNENIVAVTDASFKDEILKYEGVALVDFWASWCGPCKMLAPVLDDIAVEFEGKIKVAKVNVDESPETPSEFGVMSIPTMVIFKDGKEIERIVGYKTQQELSKILSNY